MITVHPAAITKILFVLLVCQKLRPRQVQLARLFLDHRTSTLTDTTKKYTHDSGEVNKWLMSELCFAIDRANRALACSNFKIDSSSADSEDTSNRWNPRHALRRDWAWEWEK